MEDDKLKDSDWLKSKLVDLLTDASEQSPKDHGACAKYADLLWKMLPRSVGKPQEDGALDKIRKRLLRGEPAEEE